MAGSAIAFGLTRPVDLSFPDAAELFELAAGKLAVDLQPRPPWLRDVEPSLCRI